VEITSDYPRGVNAKKMIAFAQAYALRIRRDMNFPQLYTMAAKPPICPAL
jgi:hypothetical protein